MSSLFQKRGHQGSFHIAKAIVIPIIVLCNLLAMNIMGQTPVSYGIKPPDFSVTADWYNDTIHHRVWQKQTNGEYARQANISSVRLCGHQLILVGRSASWVRSLTDSVSMQGTSCVCMGEIARVTYGIIWYIYCQNAIELGWTWAPANGISSFYNLSATLQGVKGFCLTTSKQLTLLPNTQDITIHAWGYLGTNGQWLIEPIFDAPFRFQNGFAEVLHYGVKRKINEKGEFVE